MASKPAGCFQIMAGARNRSRAPARLPPGNSSGMTTLSQSLAFHDSPQAFLSALISTASKSNTSPERQDPTRQSCSPHLVRATIIGRDVALVSDYAVAKEILGFDDDSNYQAGSRRRISRSDVSPTTEPNSPRATCFAVEPAYHDLLAPWFPPPNLLLSDGLSHVSARQNWEQELALLPHVADHVSREEASRFLDRSGPSNSIDLYKALKDLAWKIVIRTFLLSGGDHDSSDDSTNEGVLEEIKHLQEVMFRGSVSMIPVSVNTFFYKSPRSKGFAARQKLYGLLSTIVRQRRSKRMRKGEKIKREGEIDAEHEVEHLLLFTSALVVKSIASLLTALSLNVFCFQAKQEVADDHLMLGRLRNEHDLANKQTLLQSLVSETERLSPPVVGVMRRVQHDVMIDEHGADNQDNYPESTVLPRTVVPAGWDIWLYFVAANRDPSVYHDPHRFRHDRFTSEGSLPSPPTPLTFGLGSKSCIGKIIVRNILLAVLKTIVDSDYSLEFGAVEDGVKAWLGQESNDSDEERMAEVMKRDMKQLPVQRPRRAVRVAIIKRDTG